MKKASCYFILFLLFTSCFLTAQTPLNYWNGDGPNTTNSIDDSRNLYDLSYASFSPGTVVTGNTNPKVGTYITLNTVNGIIEASGSVIPITDTFAIEFIMRTGRDFHGGTIISDKGGAFQIIFEWPDDNAANPSIIFDTRTGTGAGTNDRLKLLFNGVGRKSWGWITDGNWHHFVIQYKAGTGLKEIWIDGERPTTDFYKNTTSGPLVRSASGLGIILSSGTSYEKPSCDIDEIAIYNRFLSPQIIQQHIININAGAHYATTTVITSAATISPTTAAIDPLEYELGHNNAIVAFGGGNVSVTMPPTNNALTQFKSYPLPRYQNGHTLPVNFNWTSIFYTAGELMQNPSVTSPAHYTTVSNATYLNNIRDLSIEFCQNWNLNLHSPYVGRYNEYLTSTSPITFNLTTGNGVLAKLANDSVQWENSLITLKAQIPGCVTCNKNLTSNYYLQDNTGSFILLNGSTKALRPSNNPVNFIADGDAMKNWVQSYVNALPNRALNKKITEINENGEVWTWLTNNQMSQDPVVNSDRLSSGLSWESYQGTRQRDFELVSYKNRIYNATGIDQTSYSMYGIDGMTQDRFNYNEASEIMTAGTNGQRMATGDLYMLTPGHWLNWIGAFHGFRWFSKCRWAEIASGDEWFSPFVNAGYNQPNEEATMRPGQYLGMLKMISGLGAKKFYSGYFIEGQPYPNPANYIWQVATVAYAHAVQSKMQNLYDNSRPLAGDLPWSFISQEDSSFLYNTGDLRKLCLVRKHKTQQKYIIYTAFMNNTNMTDTNTYTGVCTVNFDGQTNVKFNTRRQGSVYVWDRTVTPAVFYQVDGWHERSHPERWSKDIQLEAELADAGTFTIKTEGNTGNDYTASNAYVTFASATPLTYYIQRPETGNAIKYFWIRARSNNGGSTNVVINMSGNSDTIQCITGTSWAWYRVENSAGTPIQLNMATDGKYALTITPTNNLLEIDKIALIDNNGDVYGATATACAGSPTATISPAGPVTICAPNTQVLTANAGLSYLWSTSATTQAITVSTTGTYTVTVTSALGVATSTGTLVTVNPTVVISPPRDTANVCPAVTVNISNSVTYTGTGTKTFHATLANAIANTSPISSTVSSTGRYYTRVTTGAGCYDVDSVNVTINSCTCANPATVDAGPNQTKCEGDTVQLAGIIGGGATVGTWSNGTGQFIPGSFTNLTSKYIPSAAEVTAGSVKLYLTTDDPDGAGVLCTAKVDSVIISLNAKPTVTITREPDKTVFCLGDSVKLTATTSTSYLWSTGSTSSYIYAKNTGNYYVTITNAAGCSKAALQAMNSVTAVTPSITNDKPLKVCGTGVVNITLTSSLATGYRWSTGATTRSILTSTAGTYTVTITDGNDCTAASAGIVITDTCTAVSCGIPFGLTTTNVEFSSARLNWALGNYTPTQWKLTIKNTKTGITSVYYKTGEKRRTYLYGLSRLTTYEWYLQEICSGITYGKSETLTFKTK